MKKYFFGYLFVRLAKLLALLTALAGVCLGLFRLEQANLAAQAASYQPNLALRQNLSALAQTLSDTQARVGGFCEGSGGAAPTLERIDFPGVPGTDEQFATVSNRLGEVDGQRRQLKDALVTRFETLVDNIQAKLRAHAAEVAATPAPESAMSANPSPAPRSSPPRPPAPTERASTLYGGQMSNNDIDSRTATLERSKEFLGVLESSAEDPNNRKNLSDSVGQLDALAHLLPVKFEVPEVIFDSPLPPRAPGAPPAPRRTLNAEKVAAQLAQIRSSVRQAMLTSWTLDAAYSQAAELAESERGRCRFATLAVKGIWVDAFGRLGIIVLVTVVAAFLVLVLADFMQTLLDTATNTGVTAAATVKPSEPM